MTESKPLEGRVALITGASGGIGGALAARLAEAGADLALAYSGHREDAERVAASVGVKTLLLQGDLGDREVPGRLVERTRDELGAVDVLVPNAGVGKQLAWDEVDVDTWDTTMAVNTRAPFLLAQAALPSMIERGWGRILFVSSIAALNGGLVGPHYAASKAALHGMTYHLASRVAGKGVTVNAIAPALIGGTRILPRSGPGELPAPIPVGRLGEPDEVAAMALSMLTNAYLTNKVIAVDGGLFAY
ncbi:SDR family NAD(P)-dependent oxidoreductase [Amycolatopsis acidiphila]|uniref:SDR family NAD(P)-dependent oxidoreductase n=1 Tax=Amycolatopsis acidiphila TaxID=715473 RepID=A0A558A4K9_9PSEU|nr:SDR family NAD(P)-dependent oxidoreductase [Amycolatopsis acidiphila]TVT19193.1 SDR family NAD(P)-dependent oxidoreductase [Amycolatopsis acidiphila]UIJ62011.1 SDR family NAD(P)-dependent oxidoreductase [Amycolatopsis acidiphila]GHG56661.1 3-oxoacyl-ACP reductase [Amycolatopsis acidiphila]